MKVVRTYLTCDLCKVEVETDEATADEQGWFTGMFRLSGIRRRWHICPACVVAWLDPEDNVAAEFHRIVLEDRLGADPDEVTPGALRLTVPEPIVLAVDETEVA